MVLSDGMVHFLKIKNKKKKNLPKLSCGFKLLAFDKYSACNEKKKKNTNIAAISGKKLRTISRNKNMK